MRLEHFPRILILSPQNGVRLTVIFRLNLTNALIDQGLTCWIKLDSQTDRLQLLSNVCWACEWFVAGKLWMDQLFASSNLLYLSTNGASPDIFLRWTYITSTNGTPDRNHSWIWSFLHKRVPWGLRTMPHLRSKTKTNKENKCNLTDNKRKTTRITIDVLSERLSRNKVWTLIIPRLNSQKENA